MGRERLWNRSDPPGPHVNLIACASHPRLSPAPPRRSLLLRPCLVYPPVSLCICHALCVPLRVQGKAEAYVHVTKIKAWDVCAADAFVRSAGGAFTDLKGRELAYSKESPLMPGGIVAAVDKAVHRWVVSQLAPFEMPGAGAHR